MSKILLISALKQEAEAFCKNLVSQREIKTKPFRVYECEINSKKVLLTYSGMGAERASKAVSTAVSESDISTIISFGFAGGVRGGTEGGDTFICSELYSLDDNNLVKLEAKNSNVSIEIPKASLIAVSAPLPKSVLRKATEKVEGILLTDMETSHIAVTAKDLSIPFISLRSITDNDFEDIPFNPYDLCDCDGMPDKGKIFSFCMKNPAIIPQLASMAKKSALASENLAKAIIKMI